MHRSRLRSILDLSWTQLIVFAQGLFYLFSGAALLFAPAWFFNTFATFPPFNRHFLADAGVFALPLGVALILASRAPGQHQAVLATGAATSLLHALNHIYDDVLSGGQFSLAHVSLTTIGLLILGVLAVVAAWAASRQNRDSQSS